MNYPVPYVIVTSDAVNRDAASIDGGSCKLAAPGNNGRKIFATSVMPSKGEYSIDNVHWSAPAIFPTGNGGFEVSTFTEFSGQDRHCHHRGTEIYTVLKGRLFLFIDDKEITPLEAGDEIVILPGTVHQVRYPMYSLDNKETFELIARVHAVNCFGEDDKYVQLKEGGEWMVWSGLSREERAGAFKL